MTSADYANLTMVLLGFALAASGLAWMERGRRIFSPAALALLVAAGVVAAVPSSVTVGAGVPAVLLVGLSGALAVAGGGPVTALAFDLIDRHEPQADLDEAGSILRGGAWIGALERAAIFASLATGMPGGVALVIGLKGLGRYPELRNQENTGAAERFIIGTFTSVLWAAACAGVLGLVLA